MKYLVIIYFLFSALPLFADKVVGEGVIEPHNDALREPASAKALVMKADLDGVAQAAFGAVAQSANLDAKIALEFSNRSGMYTEALSSIVINQGGKGTVEGLLAPLAQQGPAGQRFASALLLVNNETSVLQKRKQAQLDAYKGESYKVKGLSGAAGGGKPKGKAKGKAGDSRKPALATVQVPAGLISSSDPNCSAMAILAAAYGRQADVKDAVLGAKLELGVLGARNLYLAMTGEVPSQEDLEKGLTAKGNFVTTVDHSLLDLQLNRPDAVTTVEAMGVLKDSAYLKPLAKAAKHPDVRVQVEVARAVRLIGDSSGAGILVQMLPTATWPVCIEICDGLSALPDARAIVPLITRLGKEKGRVRENLIYALSSIVGDNKGGTASDWGGWYRQSGKDFVVDAAASKAYRETHRPQEMTMPANAYFYGIKINSDRFSFVVDSSASMRGARMYSLRKNLHDTIEGLRSYVGYNICDFGGDSCIMLPGKLTNDKSIGRTRALYMPLTLGTRTFDSMDMSLTIRGLDTIVLLTDGAPVLSKGKSWSSIALGWTMQTRYAPVAVLAIDFDPSAGNKAAMIHLTASNTGQHESIEIGDEEMNDPMFLGPDKKKKK